LKELTLPAALFAHLVPETNGFEAYGEMNDERCRRRKHRDTPER
jgi:hypothetical protein